ncbi:LVIVD repeat-containing protein [Salegentibacter echinorum]|uniref:LVIVD repeat-containing protein n=1 Tax=Salegentibacter echinorum TaxID=1073325 RepID=A0A1M5I8T0_SALEC|nr:hypothetical protein [Salegentibacter echinorum]SHG24686.1 LVIVD repeat-containing protein [Salegentibacter echinorum]
MKKLSGLTVLFLLAFLSISCEKESEEGDYYNVAIPVVKSIQDFRGMVRISEPRSIEQAGKIYSYQDYVFINDAEKGVHIIDNSDHLAPQKVKFLEIPMNTDVAIKDDMLFANSAMDLVVFDLSDINNIKQKERIKDVFPNRTYHIPNGAAFVDYKNFDFENEVIVGYLIESRKIETPNGPVFTEDEFVNNSGVSGGSGTGGSLARFNIHKGFLYVVDQTNLSIFDIKDLNEAQLVKTERVGWEIETIFNKEGYLYLGSSSGMFIYDIEDPAAPQFQSMFSHILGCDPVVVKDDIAYVTIRGGNLCGQEWSQLDVIDVGDKKNPQLLKSFEMENPYGLGIKDDRLFVCDGSAGLKIYDTQDTPNLKLKDHFPDINTYDVIPLEKELLMVGDNTLFQYTYKGNKITLLSEFKLGD